ncbi:YggS family pyridoxal phosphate-dependent enzyme [Thiogranum longum]
MSRIGDSLCEIRERIAAAAQTSGRSPESVRLIAVSKQQPVPAIETLIGLGHKDFGENQIQEALGKIAVFRDQDVSWHFIGHLQSNKCRFIPGNFSWVHSVDSVKLARRIAQSVTDSGQPVRLLLQVNISNDPAKHGVQSRDLFALVEGILEQQAAAIELRGLMTIGYREARAEDARRSFADLRRLLERCRQRFGENFSELSMGMSDDYEVAIQEGATMVRIGSALFGPRT